jgi:hypothetical protein
MRLCDLTQAHESGITPHSFVWWSSRWYYPRAFRCDRIERTILLDMAGLQDNCCDVKSQVLRYLNRVELGSAESRRNSLERTDQGVMDRFVEPSSNAGS